MRQHYFLAAILGVSTLAIAQQPKVVNAQFHEGPAGASLQSTVSHLEHANGPQWLGYEVPAVPGSRFSMCSGGSRSPSDDGCCGVYRLENSDNNFQTDDHDQTAQASVDILVRIDHSVVDKVRFIRSGCQIDAGGLPFTRLSDVKPDDSVAWLSSQVATESKHLTDDALAAIAVHGATEATGVLEKFAASGSPLWLREKAAFWLAAERGHAGYLALKKMAADPDPEF